MPTRETLFSTHKHHVVCQKCTSSPVEQVAIFVVCAMPVDTDPASTLGNPFESQLTAKPKPLYYQ